MVLDKNTKNQILEFIRKKPRNINEVANLVDKSWRTADRYIKQISKETGKIQTRTFRKGTRGALKVVYWNEVTSTQSTYQKRLLDKIIAGKEKTDFSPFDIYQFANENQREAFLETEEYSTHENLKWDKILEKAEDQILFFSGNMSWVELGPENVVTDQLENLALNGVDMKVLTKIDLTSRKNLEKLLNINEKVGRDAIKIRHAEQPLRSVIIDDSFASMKEVLSPRYYRPEELNEKKYIFYKISDQEWINWLQKTFWHLFDKSIGIQTRLNALDSIIKLKKEQ